MNRLLKFSVGKGGKKMSRLTDLQRKSDEQDGALAGMIYDLKSKINELKGINSRVDRLDGKAGGSSNDGNAINEGVLIDRKTGIIKKV